MANQALQRTATRPRTLNDFMKLEPQLYAYRQLPVAVAELERSHEDLRLSKVRPIS